MSNSSTKRLPLGTTEPNARLHKWLQRGLFVCLTVLALEGTFTFPFLLVWYGWPTLSLVEMCSELEKVRFSDESRECIYPYPLFARPGHGPETAQDVGRSTQTEYRRIGFATSEVRDERVARRTGCKRAQQRSRIALEESRPARDVGRRACWPGLSPPLQVAAARSPASRHGPRQGHCVDARKSAREQLEA
jgi:hypothetical protein